MTPLFGEDLGSLHMRDEIDGKYGLIVFLGSILFFYLVNHFLTNRGPPKLVPIQDEWKWRNVYVSWIHSLISSMWTLLCMAIYPELFSGLIHHINYFTYTCITFATGYFVFDFLDLYAKGKHFTLWEVSLHHFAVVSIFVFNVVTKAQIGFSLIALSVEVNSVFLHWRKLLQMEKEPFNSPKYITIKYINLITFIIFRGVPLTVITTALFSLGDKVSLFYLMSVSTSMFVMNGINVVLLYRLIKSDVLRGLTSGKKQPTSKSKPQNDRNGNVLGAEGNFD